MGFKINDFSLRIVMVMRAIAFQIYTLTSVIILERTISNSILVNLYFINRTILIITRPFTKKLTANEVFGIEFALVIPR